MITKQLAVIIIGAMALAPLHASAHGLAGKRFFPATLTVDDPSVADEADILFIGITLPDEESGIDTDNHIVSLEWAKRITPDLGLSIGTGYWRLHPRGEARVRGFDNAELGIKYRMGTNPDAETLWSVGLDVDVGGTGSDEIGAESFSTYTPSVFFGKGFGNLSESKNWLRPLAITGAVGVAVPSRGSEPTVLEWGLTLQYDLHYLQSFVKDEGLPAPFNHMIPIIELPMETCMNHDCNGQTTGFINPGVIWSTHWGQIALEAQIPVNKRTGNDTGFLLQIHFYLDDIFPNSLGKPL